MLTIRGPQMAAFRAAVVLDFEDAMVRHFGRCFAHELSARGERSMRELVRHGIHRAARYGVASARDVCKFIDLMLVFGEDFDVQCAFAREALAGHGPRSPADVRVLFARAVEEAR